MYLGTSDCLVILVVTVNKSILNMVIRSTCMKFKAIEYILYIYYKLPWEQLGHHQCIKRDTPLARSPKLERNANYL